MDAVQGHAGKGTYHAAAEKQAARSACVSDARTIYEYTADTIYRLLCTDIYTSTLPGNTRAIAPSSTGITAVLLRNRLPQARAYPTQQPYTQACLRSTHTRKFRAERGNAVVHTRSSRSSVVYRVCTTAHDRVPRSRSLGVSLLRVLLYGIHLHNPIQDQRSEQSIVRD